MSFAGHTQDMINRMRGNKELMKSRKERYSKVKEQYLKVKSTIYSTGNSESLQNARELRYQIRLEYIKQRKKQFYIRMIIMFAICLVCVALVYFFVNKC